MTAPAHIRAAIRSAAASGLIIPAVKQATTTAGLYPRAKVIKMLRLNKNATRDQLRKLGLTAYTIAGKSPSRLYFRKENVEAAAAKRAHLFAPVPAHYITAGEACSILKCSRTTLTRLVQAGKLRQSYTQRMCAGSSCVISLFDRAAVINLSKTRSK